MTSDESGDGIQRCPYCPDGILEDIEASETVKICSNAGGCPATFVAVIA